MNVLQSDLNQPRTPDPVIAAGITFTTRVRKSPFFDATRRWGCSAYSVYNHTYMPTCYQGVEADYWNLIQGVTVWDVACERQVEVTGPEAGRFVQYLTCRDLSGMRDGQARYALLVDECGGIVNDPVILRFAADRYWISTADSDVLLWARGLAAGAGWDVTLREPDVSPLQVQGPRSVALMRNILGACIEDLRYFHFIETEIDGAPVVVSRTGYSGERGFEIFLRDGRRGDDLWERLMQAGRTLKVKPGAPSTIRRIEAGLLSYRNEMDLENTPFEIGFAGMVCLDPRVDYLGKDALARLAGQPVRRRLVGTTIEGNSLPVNEHRWPLLVRGVPVGYITSAAYSPRLGTNIAFAMVEAPHCKEGTKFAAVCDGPERIANAVSLPFMGEARRWTSSSPGWRNNGAADGVRQE